MPGRLAGRSTRRKIVARLAPSDCAAWILRTDTARGFDVTSGATAQGDGRDLQASAFAGTKLGAAGSLFVNAYARERSPGNRLLPDTRQQYFGLGSTGDPSRLFDVRQCDGAYHVRVGTRQDVDLFAVIGLGFQGGHPRA